MNMKSFQKMMKQAQQMQAKLEKEMGEMQMEASSGGGMVTVIMDGTKQLQSIKIDPEAVDPEDTEMLQDLILAAVNEAARKVDEAVSEQMGGMSDMLGGMGLH
ncbi:MAG TPA: YbaB/EbfC family nucleoid-associated protein [Acidobacteriota bacterium]|nr:YbaB/EbfC family nucleoid-associated protein [Acidobacteriota bacterium]